MAPIVRTLYDQMSDEMGDLDGIMRQFGGPFDTYAVVQGSTKSFQSYIYVPGCRQPPEALYYGVLRAAEQSHQYDTMAKMQGLAAAENFREVERKVAMAGRTARSTLEHERDPQTSQPVTPRHQDPGVVTPISTTMSSSIRQCAKRGPHLARRS